MAQIFNITHDAGNLDEYDSFVNDTDLSAETAAALADTAYGLQITIDAEEATYARKDFTQLSTNAFRFRYYIDPNTLTMGNTEYFYPFCLYDNTSSRLLIMLRYDGTFYEIRARIIDDNSAWQDTSRYDITDDPQIVEVLVQYATGAGDNNGELTLWIGEVEKENMTGLDIYNVTKPDSVRCGPTIATHAGTSGIFFLDECVLRDDDTEIGPVLPPPTGFAGIF